ncbi:MAG: zinc metalloprotease HtpX [Candidatus Thiodiazotropha sp.]
MNTYRNYDPMVWLQHTWRNRLQSLFLLSLMAAYLGLLGWLLWGPQGLIILLGVGVFGMLFHPTLSPKLIMRMYGARPIQEEQAPVLFQLIGELARRAEIETRPSLYYIPSRMLNAFTVGTPRQSAIAITDGLLRHLETREVVGVLAHEISHIRNNDLWVMGLADLFSRATSLLSTLGQLLLLFSLPLLLFSHVRLNWLAMLLLIFAPTLSTLTQMALSRTRETVADLHAVQLTGDPQGLAQALEKIERIQGGWLERVFMPGRRLPEPSLLRSHPQTEARIEQLMKLNPRQPEWIGAHGQHQAELDPHLKKPVQRHPRWHINGLWY